MLSGASTKTLVHVNYRRLNSMEPSSLFQDIVKYVASKASESGEHSHFRSCAYTPLCGAGQAQLRKRRVRRFTEDSNGDKHSAEPIAKAVEQQRTESRWKAQHRPPPKVPRALPMCVQKDPGLGA